MVTGFLVLWGDVPVVAEGVDLGAEVVYGCGLLLLEVGGVFACGLEQVFGAIQLLHKAARSVVAFERGEVFAGPGLISGRCLFLLL